MEPGPGDALPPLPATPAPGHEAFPPLASDEGPADPDNPLSGLPFLADSPAETAEEEGGFPTLPPAAGPTPEEAGLPTPPSITGFEPKPAWPPPEPSTHAVFPAVADQPRAGTDSPTLPAQEPDGGTASAPGSQALALAQAQEPGPALPQCHRQFDDLDTFTPPPEAPFPAPHPIRTLFTDLPGPAPADPWPAAPSPIPVAPSPAIPAPPPAPTPPPQPGAPGPEPSSPDPAADQLPELVIGLPYPPGATDLPDPSGPTGRSCPPDPTDLPHPPDATSANPLHDTPDGRDAAASEAFPGNSARIDALPENPSLGELAPLLADTTAADLPAWDSFLRRPPSLRCLEVLVRSLGQLHAPEVVPVLRPFLQHPIPRVRANAIEGLTDNGDPSVIPFLVPFLKDEDNRIRANAIKALSDFGVDSILEELRKMVEDDRARMRDSATWVLKGLRGREAADLLHRLLGDPEPGVRQNAIRSLAQQGDPSNADALRAFLDGNPDAEEATLARKALDYINQKQA
ncbi:MAG: HEAT repeat domain-containing protein [Candidatus Riflebacteria bacterium]|nr:HEAT repeat domain-containing protein [Candidatus Riflebacteria bacterium]